MFFDVSRSHRREIATAESCISAGRGLLLLPLDRNIVETRMGLRLLFESE